MIGGGGVRSESLDSAVRQPLKCSLVALQGAASHGRNPSVSRRYVTAPAGRTKGTRGVKVTDAE